MKFKPLYEFAIPREIEVEKVDVSVNDEGNEVRVVKKEKDTVEVKFALKKPTRSDVESGEFFFNKVVGQGILEGLLPAALLAKRLHNDGGSLSEPEKDEFAEKYVERYSLEVKIQEFDRDFPREGRTEDKQKEYDELLKDISKVNQDLQQIQLRQQSLFEITAESNARTKTIIWWMLYLLHQQNDKGEWTRVFEGEKHEHRQDSYDSITEDDVLPKDEHATLAKAVGHATHAVALWYYGRSKVQSEFEAEFKSEAERVAQQTPPTE